MRDYFIHGVIITGLFFISACATSKPVTQGQVTQCVNSDIVLIPKAKVSGKPKQWLVRVTVKVKCRNRVLNSALLKLHYPWLPEFTTLTNSQGDATVEQASTLKAKPFGTIGISIKTSDGTLNQAVTY